MSNSSNTSFQTTDFALICRDGKFGITSLQNVMTLTETMIVFRSDQISSTPFAFEMKLLFIGSEEACQSKAIDDSIILSTEEICYRPLLQIVKGRSRQTARKCFARRHISPRIENDIADEFEDGYVSDE